MKNKNFVVRTTEEFKKKVEDYAKKNNLSVSTLVIRLLSEEMKKDEIQK